MNEFKEAKTSFKRHQQSLKRRSKTRKTQNLSSKPATISPSTKGDNDEQVRSSSTTRSIDDLDETTSDLSLAPSNVAVPWMFDEQGWRTLLYGSTGHLRNRTTGNQEIVDTSTSRPIGSTKSTESSETSIVSTSIPGSTIVSKSTATTAHVLERTGGSSPSANVQGMIPQPQFLAMLNQGHLIQLLKYHLRWMAEDDITDHEVRIVTFPKRYHMLLMTFTAAGLQKQLTGFGVFVPDGF